MSTGAGTGKAYLTGTTWALQYSCGCIAEWGDRGNLTGLWVVEPCEKHARLSAADEEQG